METHSHKLRDVKRTDVELRALIERELGNTWVGVSALNRYQLRDRLSEYDLKEMAERVVRVLPAEVIVGCGGCGGEPVVAAFGHVPVERVLEAANEEFGSDDPTWPGLVRVPLIKA